MIHDSLDLRPEVTNFLETLDRTLEQISEVEQHFRQGVLVVSLRS